MGSIFLSGGAGFIGKNFLLHSCYAGQVIAPSSHQLDLVDQWQVDKLFTSQNIDTVIHAAVKGALRVNSLSNQAVIESNARMFQNLIKNKSRFSRLLCLGSGAEYARPLRKSKISEADFGAIIPEDPYGFSKFLSGQFIEHAKNQQWINLRLFSVFGPYEDYQQKFLSSAIVRALFELPIVINQDIILDYIYVKDCIKVMDQFISKQPNYVSYNIGTGISYSLVELAEMIREMINPRLPIIVKSQRIDHEYTCNNDRLLDFLGKEFVFTPIELAIKELIEFYKSNLLLLDVDKVRNQL